MKYNKLIRDRIPEILENKGVNFSSHIADDTEYWKKLKLKIVEEATEFAKDDNAKEELADILEVMHAILDHKNITFESIEEIRLKKKRDRGGFAKKIILDEADED